jgi:C4-type Zn-finger protein
MPTGSRLVAYARFMGFRDCPSCGETLFAAERAEFVCADRATLSWCCDTCGHAFKSDVDLRQLFGANRCVGLSYS